MNELKVTYQSHGIDVTLSITENWDNHGHINYHLPVIFAKIIKDLDADPVSVVEELKQEFDQEFYIHEQQNKEQDE